MSVGLVLLLGSVGLVFLSLIVLSVMEVIKSGQIGVIAYFIYKDNSIKRKRFRNIVERIEFDGLPYEYDEAMTFHIKRRKVIYYVVGNPKPISIKVNNTGTFSIDDYKNILESDIISKLFNASSSMDKNTKILLFVLAIGFIIVLFALYHWLGDGVSLAVDEGNREFIKNVVTEAIKGV